MTKQDEIAKLQASINDVDIAIAGTQADLKSPSTASDDVVALQATLIDLQSQRSELMLQLVNLQASNTEVEALPLTAVPQGATAAPPVPRSHEGGENAGKAPAIVTGSGAVAAPAKSKKKAKVPGRG